MLTLQIKEKEIENLTPEEEFVRGTVGAKCQINFDEFWQGYEKYIVFKRVGYEPINIIVDSIENEIEIPYTILVESGEFKIGVFGITETETLPTLYSKDIKILYGTDTHGTTPPTYIPSEIDQLRLSKQDKLVSGENIKTVNGESVLGSGNIKIQVEVDQTYDPTSENAQSGKAVAQAAEQLKQRLNLVFAPAIKGTVSGEVVTVKDVSPVTHELGIQLNSPNYFPTGLSFYNDTTAISWSENNGYITVEVTASATGVSDESSSQDCGWIEIPSTLIGKTLKLSFEFDSRNISGNWLFDGYLDIADGDGNYITTTEACSSSGNTVSTSFVVPEGYTSVQINPMLSFEARAAVKGYLGIIPKLEIADFSGVTVSRTGKNLFDESLFETLFGLENNTSYSETDTEYIIRNSFFSGKTYTPNITFKQNTQYTFRYTAKRDTATGYPRFVFIYTDGTRENIGMPSTEYSTVEVKSKAGKTIKYISAEYNVSGYIYIQKNSIQLEEGTVATDYEPSKGVQVVMANTNGVAEGLMSVSPDMTVMTDTDGVVIDLTYNADTKTYIDNELAKIKAELSAAILNT